MIDIREREVPLCVDIKESVKMKFQIYCIQHRTAMKEIITKLIETFLAEEEKKEKRKE
jgi:hypothetical protein